MDEDNEAGHDDDLSDAVALVTAILTDDTDGCGVIMRNCDKGTVMVTLAKLLSAAVADNEAGVGVCAEPGCLRVWAAEAITRP